MPNSYEPGYGANGAPAGGYGSPVTSGDAGDTGYGAEITLHDLLGGDTTDYVEGSNGSGPEEGGGGEGFTPRRLHISTEAFFAVPRDRRPVYEVGAEGGYFVEIVAPPGVFEVNVPYTVFFRLMQDETEVARFPDTQPSAYSAVSGSPYVIKAIRGGEAMQITTPRMDHGFGEDAIYDIVVLGGALGELIIPAVVSVLPRQFSLQINAVRTLPEQPYNPWAGVLKFSQPNDTEQLPGP